MMQTEDLKTLLYKYKDYLPFDYDKFHNDLLEGKSEALKYMAYLIKHNNAVKIRNSNIPKIRTTRPEEMIQEDFQYDRLNYTVYPDGLIRFDGYF